jgi:hypothetical protein
MRNATSAMKQESFQYHHPVAELDTQLGAGPNKNLRKKITGMTWT